VEERSRGRRLIPEVMDVRHHVVPEASLVLRRPGKVRRVEVRPQLVDGLGGDRQAEVALRFH
jgi:hypothetical protein